MSMDSVEYKSPTLNRSSFPLTRWIVVGRSSRGTSGDRPQRLEHTPLAKVGILTFLLPEQEPG